MMIITIYSISSKHEVKGKMYRCCPEKHLHLVWVFFVCLFVRLLVFYFILFFEGISKTVW